MYRQSAVYENVIIIGINLLIIAGIVPVRVVVASFVASDSDALLVCVTISYDEKMIGQDRGMKWMRTKWNNYESAIIMMTIDCMHDMYGYYMVNFIILMKL